jgi:hypothetical protein
MGLLNKYVEGGGIAVDANKPLIKKPLINKPAIPVKVAAPAVNYDAKYFANTNAMQAADLYQGTRNSAGDVVKIDGSNDTEAAGMINKQHATHSANPEAYWKGVNTHVKGADFQRVDNEDGSGGWVNKYQAPANAQVAKVNNPGFRQHADGYIEQRRVGKGTGEEHWERSNARMAAGYAQSQGMSTLGKKELMQQYNKNPQNFINSFKKPQPSLKEGGLLRKYVDGGDLGKKKKLKPGDKVDNKDFKNRTSTNYQEKFAATDLTVRANSALIPEDRSPWASEVNAWTPSYEEGNKHRLDVGYTYDKEGNPVMSKELTDQQRENARMQAKRQEIGKEISSFRRKAAIANDYYLKDEYGRPVYEVVDGKNKKIEDLRKFTGDMTMDLDVTYPEGHKKAGQRRISEEEKARFYNNLRSVQDYTSKAGFRTKEYWGEKEAAQQGYNKDTRLEDLKAGIRLMKGDQTGGKAENLTYEDMIRGKKILKRDAPKEQPKLQKGGLLNKPKKKVSSYKEGSSMKVNYVVNDRSMDERKESMLPPSSKSKGKKKKGGLLKKKK